ncbi:MAG TPA: hypothetical protein VHP34_05810 [Alphaproteobacteria bacterium]|jgi:hypothetical protein|nr:hypothetical protein [Alphaproteobacteria bacterium]
MALDNSDYKLIQSLRQAVRDGDEITHSLLRQLNARAEEQLAQQREMITAFNRVADAIEGLRDDLAPKLDKSGAGLKKPKALRAKNDKGTSL